jgi:glycerophosphoryl diester phosphodiesterase
LTLDEGLNICRGRMPVTLDIKVRDAVPAVVEAIHRTGTQDQVVITGCRPMCITEVRRLDPDLSVQLNLTTTLRLLGRAGPAPVFRVRSLSMAERTGSDGLNLDHRFVDRGLIDAAYDAGLSVWAWTVDDIQRARDLVSMGVNSITTNWPAPMAVAIAEPRNQRD